MFWNTSNKVLLPTFSVGSWVSVARHTKQAGDMTFFLNAQELTEKENYVFGKPWKSAQRARDLHLGMLGETKILL